MGPCLTRKCNDPNARISAKSKIHSNLSLVEGIGNNIEKAIQRCKPKSEVVEPVDENTSKQPRTWCNAKHQPNPQAASFLFTLGIANPSIYKHKAKLYHFSEIRKL